MRHTALESWLENVRQRNVDQTVAGYAEDAVLLGTLSPIVRQGRKAIGEYFQMFLDQDALEVEVTQEVAREFDDLSISSGLYTFSLTKKGETKTVPARFSFVFRRKGSTWEIVEHHSSRLP